MTASFDTSELYALAEDLGAIAGQTFRTVRSVYVEAADDLRDKWRANAKETAGQHGRLYPLAITAEEHVGTRLDFEIGPESNKPQGRMSFEYGSVNQPPHLDGQRAADEMIPTIERRIVEAAEDLF